MKKLSLLTLVFATGMSVYAQDQGMGMTTSPTLRTPMSTAARFGVKGGVNLATLNFNHYPAADNINTNNKTSFHVGFLANVPLGGMMRFQPELLYSGHGSKISQNVTTGASTTNQSYEQDLNYIAVPMMFQYQSLGGFVIEAGPQVSYLVQAKQDGPGNMETENEGGYDRFDIAGAAGIGYLSRVGLGINARYNFGLANIIDDGGSKDGPEQKNRVISIGLSYHFGANK